MKNFINKIINHSKYEYANNYNVKFTGFLLNNLYK